jgi:membrane-bound inhibitor of C-type lysozyme
VKTGFQQAYDKLPLFFEANVGQANNAVQFLARGPGYGLYLTETGAVMVLCQGSSLWRGPAPQDPLPAGQVQPTVLRMRFLDSNPVPRVIGREKLPGMVNYLLGKDPAKWRANIPTFARVEYKNVYPGIDLVYYGNPGQLEYDFVVAPGADPQAIHLSFTGANQVSIDSQGNLLLGARGNTILLHTPVAYQERSGSRQEIASAFVLLDEGGALASPPGELSGLTRQASPRAAHAIGFQLASYDKSRPLVIDPVLSFSTYLGGGSDEGRGIAVDPKTGDVLIVGSTGSTSFPTANPLQPNEAGGSDAFVTRLSADGSTLVFSTYLGGSGADYGNGIAVDPSTGDALITGATNSTDFPTANPLQPNSAGDYDTFVARLSADGSTLVFATYLGGSGADYSNAISVDPTTGQAVVTGTTVSTDFPTAGPLQSKNGGGNDVFVTRLSADGSALVFSTYFGGNGSDYANGIAVDPASGHILVTGSTNSTNFPTANPLQPNSAGDFDVFVTRLSADGSTLIFSTYFGGSGADYANAISVNPGTGDAFITGATNSLDFPTANALQPNLVGSNNIFVVRLSADGGTLVFSTYLGGSGADYCNSITVDPSTGDALITGQTNSADFPTANPLQANDGGGNDAFVARLSADGSTLVFATFLGGGGVDYGRGITLDPATGDALITGATFSMDFPTASPLQPNLAGGNDVFVARISF